MVTNRILLSLTIAAPLVAGVLVSHSAAADQAACDSASSDCLPAASACGCPLARICARCRDKACVTIASPGKETKSCWDVECDDVCLPAVRFPWDCCRKSRSGECLGTLLPRCGKVRRVRKLKGVEYECDKCEYDHKYDHKIVETSPDCGAHPHSDCAPSQPESVGGDLSRYLGHSIATSADVRLQPPAAH